MTESDRPTLSPERWDGHLVLLARGATDLEAGVTSWVARALDARGRVVYAENAGKPEGHAVLDVLGRNGLDGAAAAARNAIERLPVAQFWAPGRFDTMCDEALSDGFSSLRLLAAATDGVAELGEQAYLSVERDVDEARHVRPIHAMCQYSVAELSDAIVAGGIGMHAGGVRETLFHTRVTDDALLISGEIDAHNDPLFGYVIEGVMETESDVVRLDFGEVTFLGVGGVRSIVRGSAEFRRRGGRVELARPSADLVRLLRVLSLDELKGIDIQDGES